MKIAPSVLAADFSNLECELKDIETGGADLVHLDVMDGRRYHPFQHRISRSYPKEATSGN